MDQPNPQASFSHILKYASKGDISSIQYLLKEKPSLLNEKSGGHNRTLLWEAVNSSRVDLVRYLIEKGADVNIPGRYRNETFVLLKPYCIAVKKKYFTIRDLLLTNGHQMDVFSMAWLGDYDLLSVKIQKDKTLIHKLMEEEEVWEISLLHYALAGENFQIAKMLIEQGAEVNKYSKLLYEIACRLDRFDFVKLFTQAGGAPNMVDVPSVLHNNNEEIIRFFFENGLDSNKLTWMGWPPIAYLSRGDKGEHPERIKTLIQYGANINAQNSKGVSALHAASKAGFLKVVKILIAAGADQKINDFKGKTPLDYAKKYRKGEVEQFLLENGAC